MKKHIKVKFIDQWNGWRPEISRDYRLLAQRYEVELSETPDYVMCGGLGEEHLKYDNAVKILCNGENVTPDFNLYDYASGFDYIEFGDRYIRHPLYAGYDGYGKVCSPNFPADEILLKRKFCSFVVTNGGGDPMRATFFKKLSEYKQVDSGGAFMNNVGGRVSDKLAFCAKYKFNIAFENSCYPGYVTEKIMEPLSVYSVPIYYGAPDVEKDFSENCFIRLRSMDDIEKVVNRIVELDNNDDDYLSICKAERLPNGVVYSDDTMANFLYSIFDRDISSVRRRADYGMQVVYRHRLQKLFHLKAILTKPVNILRKIKSLM